MTGARNISLYCNIPLLLNSAFLTFFDLITLAHFYHSIWQSPFQGYKFCYDFSLGGWDYIFDKELLNYNIFFVMIFAYSSIILALPS